MQTSSGFGATLTLGWSRNCYGYVYAAFQGGSTTYTTSVWVENDHGTKYGLREQAGYAVESAIWDQTKQALFRACQILRWIHRPQNWIPRDLPVKCAHQTPEPVLPTDRPINLCFFHDLSDSINVYGQTWIYWTRNHGRPDGAQAARRGT